MDLGMDVDIEILNQNFWPSIVFQSVYSTICKSNLHGMWFQLLSIHREKNAWTSCWLRFAMIFPYHAHSSLCTNHWWNHWEAHGRSGCYLSPFSRYSPALVPKRCVYTSWSFDVHYTSNEGIQASRCGSRIQSPGAWWEFWDVDLSRSISCGGHYWFMAMCESVKNHLTMDRTVTWK